MPPDSPQTIRFGVFAADVRAGELRRQGAKVKLSGQPFEILALLLERPGEVVTREELRQKLWPANTFVDFDHSMNAAVNKLREALGDSAETPRFVETLPRRGYRFIAPVAKQGSAAPAAVVGGGPAEAPARRKRRSLLAAGLGIAALLLLAILAVGLRRKAATASLAGEIRSLAVLPFENLSRDPEQEYFAEGMTEALISRLSQIRALHVISRTSVMQYKKARKPLPEIAKELRVQGVVEGAVQRSGDRVRISAKLIHAESDRSLWAASYERDLSDVLELQSEVAQAITEEIRVRATSEERTRLWRTHSVNPDIYQLFLKGRFYQNKATGWASKRAIEYFREAIRRDPGYALAYAGLAEAEVFGYPPKDAMPRAKAAALRAVELDPTLPEAHAVTGLLRTFWDWDWTGAEASFRRAIELDPTSDEIRYRYSHYLAAMGRFDEAIAECRRAFELDPLSPNVGHYLGRIYYFARQNDRAIEQLKKTLELDPNNFWTNFFLAVVFDRREMHDEAVTHWLRAATLEGIPEEPIAAARQIYEKSGYETFLRTIADFEAAQTAAAQQPLGSSSLALRYSRLGEKEKALTWLEKAFDSHTRDLIYMNVEPAYDPLRGDPRFIALLRRLGLSH